MTIYNKKKEVLSSQQEKQITYQQTWAHYQKGNLYLDHLLGTANVFNTITILSEEAFLSNGLL